MAALIYRAYEFEKLVSVRKLCQFPPDLEIEIASSAINAMRVILVSVLTHGNVNLSVHLKETFVFMLSFSTFAYFNKSDNEPLH